MQSLISGLTTLKQIEIEVEKRKTTFFILEICRNCSALTYVVHLTL